ncbi:hypothetical protein [Lacrimispora sp.]|uniref:hypothetical protein n=1 Tax=Lacrimispora sp. TaxID=2719234 RepID=UPI0028B19A89|nr:hypothetical protein [Lacrimispora sp.]
MLNNLLKVTKNVISKCVKPVLESAKKAFQPQINNLKNSTLGKVAAKILPVVNSPTVKSGFSQVQKALALPKAVAPAKKEGSPTPQSSSNNQAKQLSASSNSPAPQEENVQLLEQYKGTESSLLEDIIRGAVKSDAGQMIFKVDLDSPAMKGFFAMLRTVTSPGFKNTGLKDPYEELKAGIKDKFNEAGNDVYNAHIPIASNFIGAFTNSSDYKQQGPLPLESEKTNHLLAILHYSMYANKAGGTLNHADALTTYQNMVSNANMASVIGANAGGALISGGAGLVDSIIETVLDPYEFQKNLFNLVVNSPVIIPNLFNEIGDYSKHYVYEASPQEKAKVKGRIIFELASLAVLSAIGKASKGAEATQGAQKTEAMVKNGSEASALVDEGGVSITKTEDVLAANRGVGEVVEEGVKKGSGNAGKTGEAIEGTGHARKNSLNIVKETDLFVDYVNESGTVIRVPKQTPQSIADSISKNLDSADIGVSTEAKVADFIKNNTDATITDFGNKIKSSNGNLLGDIDVATENSLIEVKASISSVKEKQLYKYIDSSKNTYINTGNKKAILYIGEPIDMANPNNVKLLERIKDMGVTVVNDINELKGLVK